MNKNNYNLHSPSDEQKQIITELIKNNVFVQAVAGSGKTTTALHIANAFKNKKILLLTYNKKLSLETNKKVKLLNLINLTAYTFHAFSAFTWQINCQNDEGLLKIINSDLKPAKKLYYDLIIIDEAQDINPISYEILCKIINYNEKNANLCILGDKNQSIYNFQNADSRYLTFANKVFNLNNLPWKHCQLSVSYRLTQPMVEFINDVFYQEKIMSSIIPSEEKIDYIVTNAFNSQLLINEIKKLIQKYGKNNIFILAPSIKKDTTPVRKLTHKLSNEGILIYAPTNDDEKLDPTEMENKLCLSTFHQAKGLERKAVVVFGFDLSYFKFNARKENPLKPANVLYVAISRALEKLLIVHHIKNEVLPFINKDKIQETANFKIVGEEYERKEFNALFNKKFEKIDEFESINIGVTDLIRFLPSNILSFCKKLISITEIKQNESDEIKKTKKLFNIPTKLKLERNGETYQENVSAITGTATILNYEWAINNNSTPLSYLLWELAHNREKVRKETPNLFKYETFLQKLENRKDWIVNDILLLSTLWNYFIDHYNFKLNQIPNEKYDWVKETDFEKINNLIKTKLSNKTIFETRIEIDEMPELLEKKLTGFIDCIDLKNKTIWEFKFVDKVTQEHHLQLALYAYLISTNKEYKNQKFKYFIYNIKKDQLFELKITLNDLIEIVKTIFYHKYGKNNNISDNAFLKNAMKILQKYKK